MAKESFSYDINASEMECLINYTDDTTETLNLLKYTSS